MSKDVQSFQNPMVKSLIIALFNLLKQYVASTPSQIDDFVVEVLEFTLKKLKIL